MQPDEFYMARAFELARLGRFTTSPNPNVGCVLFVMARSSAKVTTYVLESRMLKCMRYVWRVRKREEPRLMSLLSRVAIMVGRHLVLMRWSPQV